jgi:putative Mn2+ efflux pump MntP
VQVADPISILGIAIGLSLDAFSVAITASVTLPEITRRHLFRLAFHFGLFQALMPVLGWLAGRSVESVVREWDHWVAFGLLFLIGAQSIKCGFSKNKETSSEDPTRGLTLVALSVATSIDALAVGFTFAVLGVKIVVPALVIGLVASLMTLVGMFLGRRLGGLLGKKAEILAGLVLIGIGVKILVEHLLE